MATFQYIRYSSDKQKDDRQVEKLKQYLFLHPEFGTPCTITDPANSSIRPFAKRSGGSLLLTRVSEGDIVIVTEVDRLGRASRDIRRTIAYLCDRGVKIYILNFIPQFIPLDPDDPMCDVFLAMWAMVAELERRLIGARAKEGLAAKKARMGYIREPIPPGYKRIRGPDGQMMAVIDENEMAAVSLIRKWRSCGVMFDEIVNRLDRLGYRKSRPKRGNQHGASRSTNTKWNRWDVNLVLTWGREKSPTGLPVDAEMADFAKAAEALT